MSYKIPVKDIIENEIKNIVKENKEEILKEIIDCIPLSDSDDDSKVSHLYNSKPEDKVQDAYHTMDELYHHRTILFAVLCSNLTIEIITRGRLLGSWKSKKHSDGTEEDGWFIAGIQTPDGQITYHQKMEYWDLFKCKELDKAPEYDGHTSDDVIDRLIKTFLS